MLTVCSAVDTIGPIFINNIVKQIFTATFPLFPLKFRANSLPKIIFSILNELFCGIFSYLATVNSGDAAQLRKF
jgi:hypothetical protein